MKKVIIFMIAVIVVIGGITYLMKNKTANQIVPIISKEAQQKKSSQNNTNKDIVLPWLTKENLMTGHLNDDSLGLGNTKKEVVDQLGKPDLTGNYEGAYYKYNHKMIFFFPQGLPEDIKDSDPIAKLMLDTDGMKITISLLNQRFGQPKETDISEVDDEKYSMYSIGKYDLIANLDEQNQITSLELYMADK
ncbi:DUF4309 domain-containing protein [Paenibacillus kyungheensis]